MSVKLKMEKVNNGLVFYSSENVHRRDAKGAFIPEAKAFAGVFDLPKENIVPVPCKSKSKVRRRNIVLKELRSKKSKSLDVIAFFIDYFHIKKYFASIISTYLDVTYKQKVTFCIVMC